MAVGFVGETLPKSPLEAVKQTFQTPDVMAGGVGATVFKSITKTGGIKLGSALLGAGVGLEKSRSSPGDATG